VITPYIERMLDVLVSDGIADQHLVKLGFDLVQAAKDLVPASFLTDPRAIDVSEVGGSPSVTA
jgi:hypothetical protein